MIKNQGCIIDAYMSWLKSSNMQESTRLSIIDKPGASWQKVCQAWQKLWNRRAQTSLWRPQMRLKVSLARHQNRCRNGLWSVRKQVRTVRRGPSWPKVGRIDGLAPKSSEISDSDEKPEKQGFLGVFWRRNSRRISKIPKKTRLFSRKNGTFQKKWKKQWKKPKKPGFYKGSSEETPCFVGVLTKNPGFIRDFFAKNPKNPVSDPKK